MLNVFVRPQPAAVAAVSAPAATAGKTPSDEILVEQIAAGSKPAMQALSARHRTSVYRWLLRFVSNETLAEDLLSEVFLDVWHQAGQFEGRAAVTTWLLSIARFKALSARRRRTDAELDEIEATVADSADDPEITLQKKSRNELPRQAMSNLSADIARFSIWCTTRRSRSRIARSSASLPPPLRPACSMPARSWLSWSWGRD